MGVATLLMYVHSCAGLARSYRRQTPLRAWFAVLARLFPDGSRLFVFLLLLVAVFAASAAAIVAVIFCRVTSNIHSLPASLSIFTNTEGDIYLSISYGKNRFVFVVVLAVAVAFFPVDFFFFTSITPFILVTVTSHVITDKTRDHHKKEQNLIYTRNATAESQKENYTPKDDGGFHEFEFLLLLLFLRRPIEMGPFEKMFGTTWLERQSD